MTSKTTSNSITTKKFKFTNANLKSLPSNPVNSSSTELEVSDTEIIGLKCLSGKTGNKRFLLRYKFNCRKCSITIGRFPDIDINQARKVARKYKGLIADGIDPKAQRDNATEYPTVKSFFYDTYLPLAKRRKKTWPLDEKRFRKHCNSIANIKYNELTASHVMKLHLTLSETKYKGEYYAPATCNRLLALLKTMGKLANSMLDIINVADRVSLLPENNARTRYCDIDETKRIIKAARAYPKKSFGNFIALLHLIGCRESELRFRVHSDINYEKRTLTIPRTKNGTYHIIYLSDLMIEILQSTPKISGNNFVFPAPHKKGKPIARPRDSFDVIKRMAGIENPEEVLLHTARHSVASNLISNGVDISSVQKLLNHKDISSTLRYAKLSEGKQRETGAMISSMVGG
jgi:integrase